MMKVEVLAALLLFLTKAEGEAGVRLGQCRGDIVDVFVESSYLSTGHSSLDPDPYVQVRVTSLLFLQFIQMFGQSSCN